MRSTARHCIIYFLLAMTSSSRNELQGSLPPIPPAEKKADHFFKATLFEESIPLYEEALSTLSVKTEGQARVRLHLAQAYFFSGQYAKIPDTLSKIDATSIDSSSQIHQFNTEAIYLLAQTYQKIKQYDLAVTTLKQYLSLEDQTPLIYKEEAKFELGLAYFHNGEGECAKNQWEEFSETSEKERLFLLSKIYLARLAIDEGQFPQAESLLHLLSHQIELDDVLQYALSFLRGEILFSQQQWHNAATHFEQAIPSKNHEKADWYHEALYNLGWCHLNLGDISANISENRREHLSKAEKCFLTLIEASPSDRAYLALGQCYLAKGSRLNEDNAYEELKRLLLDKSLFETDDAQYQALLLRAEVSSPYSERKRLFRQLTHESNCEYLYYANAWYLQGLNELDAEQATKERHEAKHHLDLAIKSLRKAFDLFYPTDKILAALSMKYQVHAHQLFGHREGYLKSLSLLSQLLDRYRDTLFSLLENPDEIYFLQGLAASHLVKEDEKNTFFEIAENSLTHAIESYPNGKFYPESLELLGTLYYQNECFGKSEDLFLKLANVISSSPSAGEAWYWAARSVECQGKDEQRRKQYLKNTYEAYPQSPYADEAYFRYYSYADYVGGKPEAIEHLESLKTKFCQSVYLIHVHYLMGLHALHENGQSLNLSNAIERFRQAEETFDRLFDEKMLPQENVCDLMTIRYRAMLERGSTYLTLSQNSEGAKKRVYLEHAEEIFLRMYNDSQNPKHFLAADGSYLQEEGSFLLAKCYTQANKDEAAERVFANMLERYHSAKITRSYYLSRVWYEQGRIAGKHKEYELAIEYFKHADDAGKGKILSTNELLDLWIQESLSYQGISRMDEAMLLLSRVINYNAISGQRLRAMYLRAEIYEKQERYELAKIQLEATAKQGGEWSLRAKEKLEESYAYR